MSIALPKLNQIRLDKKPEIEEVLNFHFNVLLHFFMQFWPRYNQYKEVWWRFLMTIPPCTRHSSFSIHPKQMKQEPQNEEDFRLSNEWALAYIKINIGWAIFIFSPTCVEPVQKVPFSRCLSRTCWGLKTIEKRFEYNKLSGICSSLLGKYGFSKRIHGFRAMLSLSLQTTINVSILKTWN